MDDIVRYGVTSRQEIPWPTATMLDSGFPAACFVAFNSASAATQPSNFLVRAWR
jgi:hypothetical protein